MNKIDYIGKLILNSNEDHCSNEFIDNVMSLCYKYEKKKARIKKYKKYSLFTLPILLIILFLFIPFLNEFILMILNRITLMIILRYYVLTTTSIIISFYIIMIERIFKFIKMKSISQNICL